MIPFSLFPFDPTGVGKKRMDILISPGFHPGLFGFNPIGSSPAKHAFYSGKSFDKTALFPISKNLIPRAQ
jgi:hypothetical protein